MSYSNTLGEKITRLRIKKGLTLTGLAKTAGISKSYLWELEKKFKEKTPSAKVIKKLADSLDVSVEFLLDDKEFYPTESQYTQAFITKFNALNIDNQELATNLINTILANQNKQ